MLAAPIPPSQRKRGFARRPKGQVKAKTLANRLSLDRRRLKALVEAGIDPPAELLGIEPAIKGRPALSAEAIQRKEHASARRTRDWRAAHAAAQRALEEAEAAGALAQLACAPEAEAEAERASQRRRPRDTPSRTGWAASVFTTAPPSNLEVTKVVQLYDCNFVRTHETSRREAVHRISLLSRRKNFAKYCDARCRRIACKTCNNVRLLKK